MIFYEVCSSTANYNWSYVVLTGSHQGGCPASTWSKITSNFSVDGLLITHSVAIDSRFASKDTLNLFNTAPGILEIILSSCESNACSSSDNRSNNNVAILFLFNFSDTSWFLLLFLLLPLPWAKTTIPIGLSGIARLPSINEFEFEFLIGNLTNSPSRISS